MSTDQQPTSFVHNLIPRERSAKQNIIVHAFVYAYDFILFYYGWMYMYVFL